MPRPVTRWGHFTIEDVGDAVDSWCVAYDCSRRYVMVPKERYPDWPRIGDRLSIALAPGDLRVDQCAIGEKLVWDLRP